MAMAKLSFDTSLPCVGRLLLRIRTGNLKLYSRNQAWTDELLKATSADHGFLGSISTTYQDTTFQEHYRNCGTQYTGNGAPNIL
jgi:hypothetical protein